MLQIALSYWILFDIWGNLGGGLKYRDGPRGALCPCAFYTLTILYKPFGPVMWAVLMRVCSQAYYEFTVWETEPKEQPKGASNFRHRGRARARSRATLDIAFPPSPPATHGAQARI